MANGWRVLALAPDYDDALRARVRALGAEAIDYTMSRTGMHPGRDLIDAMALARQLRLLRVNAVFAYFIKPVIYGTLAAALARVPRRYALIAGLGYVFTPDGDRMPLRRRMLRASVALLYRLALRFADTVFFQNQDDLDQFAESGLVDPKKAIRLNGTGVDLERLHPAPLLIEPVTFLLIARLLREKGIAEFVAGARELKRDHPQARFILLGGLDPNPGGLSLATVESWRNEGVIEWPGHVDDVLPWLREGSVFVLPSYREGAPRSTQEAMALGRPIVTTDAVGCRETVVDGENGFLVKVRDVATLAAAMRRFLEDPSLIEPMGRASRRLAEERFDVRRINKVMLHAMGITS